MRDPKRIPEVLARVEAVWAKHPDLRLGQMLLNLDYGPFVYHMEDEALVERLEEYYD